MGSFEEDLSRKIHITFLYPCLKVSELKSKKMGEQNGKSKTKKTNKKKKKKNEEINPIQD